MERREFMKYTVAAGASLLLEPLASLGASPANKMKLAMVGTGVRGSGLWGRELLKNFGEMVEFVGLCDHNPGRLNYVKQTMGVSCPAFTNFDQMLSQTKPDYVIVTTVDSTP